MHIPENSILISDIRYQQKWNKFEAKQKLAWKNWVDKMRDHLHAKKKYHKKNYQKYQKKNSKKDKNNNSHSNSNPKYSQKFKKKVSEF